MGNFKWRLAQALNRHAENIRLLGLEDEVEVLVADWGSQIPLFKVLDLTDTARQLIRFLIVPPDVAKTFDKDAGYSNVHPINSVARRAEGKYVMFSDSDVYIPLTSMAQLMFYLRRDKIANLPLDEYFFWGSKYHIPVDVVRQDLSFPEISDYIDRNWMNFHYDPVDQICFRGAGVCLLTLRDYWHKIGGWDERFIYWGWFDIDLHRRLRSFLRWDVLENHGVKIFHLEHYTARFEADSQQKECKLKVNPQIDPIAVTANTEDWGLRDFNLIFLNGYGNSVASTKVKNQTPQPLPPKLQTVTETLRDYEQLPAFTSSPVTQQGFHPVFSILNAALSPKTLCVVCKEGLSYALLEALESRALPEILVVDTWSRDSIDNSIRSQLNKEEKYDPFLGFLRAAEARGIGNKITALAATPRDALAELLEQNCKFDAVIFFDIDDREGERVDVVGWNKLLKPSGFVYGHATCLHPGLYHTTESNVSELRAQGLRRAEVPMFWLWYPEALESVISAHLALIKTPETSQLVTQLIIQRMMDYYTRTGIVPPEHDVSKPTFQEIFIPALGK